MVSVLDIPLPSSVFSPVQVKLFLPVMAFYRSAYSRERSSRLQENDCGCGRKPSLSGAKPVDTLSSGTKLEYLNACHLNIVNNPQRALAILISPPCLPWNVEHHSSPQVS